MGKKELNWLSIHEKEVEKYSGKWIAFTAEKGTLGSGESVKEAIDEAHKKNSAKKTAVFKVPRKDEEMYVLCRAVFSNF